MVAYKTGSVARFLKAPDPACLAALLYGPDAGLVAERAQLLGRAVAGKDIAQTEIVRLDERDLALEPGRLEVELRTLPMFASRKIVRVNASGRFDVPALKALLGERLDGFLIVEAGGLRPDSALRKLFEAHASAVALPCYGDEQGSAKLIDEELAAANLRIDAETKAYLLTRIGADQALSRAEVAKLALFARGKERVGADDIDAIVGDSGEIAVEAFVEHAGNMDAKQALRQLRRLETAGTSPASALAALGRHFTQLHRIVAALAGGASAESAMRSLRPRPHFKMERIFTAQARRWSHARLLKAIQLTQAAIQQTRRSPDLERAFAEQLVLALSQTEAAPNTRIG